MAVAMQQPADLPSIEELEARVSGLRKRLEAKIDENQQLRYKIADLESALDLAREARKRLTDLVVQESERADKAANALRGAHERSEELQKQLDIVTHQRDQLREEVAELRDDNDHMQALTRNLMTEARVLRQSIRAAQQHIAELEKAG